MTKNFNIKGRLFALDGAMYLLTESNRLHPIEDQEFYRRCREDVEEIPSLAADVVVRRTTTFLPSGNRTEYSIVLFAVTPAKGRMFYAFNTACEELVKAGIERSCRDD